MIEVYASKAMIALPNKFLTKDRNNYSIEFSLF